MLEVAMYLSRRHDAIFEAWHDDDYVHEPTKLKRDLDPLLQKIFEW